MPLDMHAKLVAWLVMASVLVTVAVREFSLWRELRYLHADKERLLAEQRSIRTRSDELVATVQALQSQAQALESQLRYFSNALSRSASFNAGPEYDPTRSPPLERLTSRRRVGAQNRGRGWGPEQATGPPDTEQAGDYPTAWASREPDGGDEWLQADFERAVDIAQVRIRETYNPGAITRVAAMVNGQEVALWEGDAAAGEAPREFVVSVNSKVNARAIMIHLDTTRVPGWNEIDAVELVGSDGSRQWTNEASASSTFAEPGPIRFRRLE
jgi:hypothetical protein